MSQARELLDAGWAVSMEEFAIPFTVDGYGAHSFSGLCDEVRYSNELGAGGFALDADATIGVEVSEFAAVGLTPYPGMRMQVYGVNFIVDRVGKNDHRWNLTLEEAQTKKAPAGPPRIIVSAPGSRASRLIPTRALISQPSPPTT